MSGSANLDLRYPIGLLFVVLGIILAAYGMMTVNNTAMYVQSGGININLIWGLIMILFGAVVSAFAFRAGRRP